MGKAFTTAVRWLAPLGAILNPKRPHPGRWNDTELAVVPTPKVSQQAEMRRDMPQAGPGVVGIALRQPTPATLKAHEDTGLPPSTPHAHAMPPSSLRPLRVLRIRESGPHPRRAGRLVISGRMADVCAELERLAAADPGLMH
ncbi:MAG: hypothetical protein EKK45_18580 [Curvibacter sp.]|nr:MAG: hypothetical protein EKK45_18580 [Curvibacter sp.]